MIETNSCEPYGESDRQAKWKNESAAKFKQGLKLFVQRIASQDDQTLSGPPACAGVALQNYVSTFFTFACV